MTVLFDEFPDETDDDAGAEVIDLFTRHRKRTEPDPETSEPRTRLAAGVRYEPAANHPRTRRARPGPVDQALVLLATARDDTLSPIERSNAFDAWRDALVTLSRSTTTTNESRELLGLLLACVRKRDLPDLASPVLEALLDGTARLKSPRAVTIDVERISSALRRAGATTILPLATDGLDEEALQELEAIIARVEQPGGS